MANGQANITINAVRPDAPKKTASYASSGLEDYFVGPIDPNRHSKWPIFLRLHGSVTPEMVVPLLVVGLWSTLITCLSKYVHPLGINSVLLTVLGFVVGLGLSFRSSTAYERWTEGRKYWAQLSLVSQNLARLLWVHVKEREGEEGKGDLLGKVSALNLIVALSVALKHRLRFEPYAHYPDLHHLVAPLDTLASKAEGPPEAKRKTFFKSWGEFLGVPMAESNPRKLIKNATQPLGNMPLEILTALNGYIKFVMENETFTNGICQSNAFTALVTMNDVLTGTERVLNTPLPIAYSIAIGQITWVYILLLPFQLYIPLGWITIPGCIFAAYIILGIALIGREIENPFGNDVNDLPLDLFCQQIRQDLDIIMRQPAPNPNQWINREDNMLMWPLSHLGYAAWNEKGTEKVREALALKPELAIREEGVTLRKSEDVSKGQV